MCIHRQCLMYMLPFICDATGIIAWLPLRCISVWGTWIIIIASSWCTVYAYSASSHYPKQCWLISIITSRTYFNKILFNWVSFFFSRKHILAISVLKDYRKCIYILIFPPEQFCKLSTISVLKKYRKCKYILIFPLTIFSTHRVEILPDGMSWCSCRSMAHNSACTMLVWFHLFQSLWILHMGEATKVWLSCYRVLLSNDSKTR